MTIRTFWAGLATAAALGLAACATPGAQAPLAQADGSPILDTRYGPVSGTLEGVSNSVNVFRGVRYAASTEGRTFGHDALSFPPRERGGVGRSSGALSLFEIVAPTISAPRGERHKLPVPPPQRAKFERDADSIPT